MAPGVCVTSFRMLIRRMELSSHLCRGLRLTPSGPYLMNSWSARNYCKKQDDASTEELQKRQGNTKTVNNEQTVSSDKESHTLDKKSLLATDENCSKDDDLTLLKLTQLRAQLRNHGQSSVGRKDVLVKRLQSYLTLKSGKTIITHIPSDTKDDNLKSSKSEDQTSKNDGTAEHDLSDTKGDVYVEYIQGLPHLTVPLPSRLEKCRFALKPVSHKVGDLIEMLKIEDHGIDRAVVLNRCGVRIASTCAIDSLLDEPFWLQINDNKYEVIPPKRKKIDSEDLQRLSDVRTLVAQLYEALHVGEYHLYKEQELVTKLENLKFEISPLEMEKQELTKLAERKTVIATWVGLSLMAVQFGVLARLTWWEYSWDIMEPVTYFVTYGTTMAMYAYYCLTKSEYAFENVRDRLFLISIHNKAKRKNFDVDKYNLLKRQIAEAEYDLRRLRDPINLQLPPHIDRAQRIRPIEPSHGGSKTTGSDTRIVSAVTFEKKPVSFRLPFLEPKN
ncbi:calcium uniporter protein, mitochondrial isoform X2 [Eurosta solidaginis]|uniref:calcium uniporter protein, mitochondrial isoform X2 n=1 Tax=Eurosta solidaginis TaxID=178769 RepID=UPI0035311946